MAKLLHYIALFFMILPLCLAIGAGSDLLRLATGEFIRTSDVQALLAEIRSDCRK